MYGWFAFLAAPCCVSVFLGCYLLVSLLVLVPFLGKERLPKNRPAITILNGAKAPSNISQIELRIAKIRFSIAPRLGMFWKSLVSQAVALFGFKIKKRYNHLYGDPYRQRKD